MNLKEEDIKKQITKLQNLVVFKDKPLDYIRSKAIEILEKKEVDIDTDALFKNKDERKKAKILVNKYLKDFPYTTISEKNILKDLIRLEVIQDRLYEELNDIGDEGKGVSLRIIKGIRENSEAILRLKDSLGLLKDKDVKDKDYDILEKTKKKFAKWREKNNADRTLFVPGFCRTCGRKELFGVLLKIRTKIWEAQKHPLFSGRVLYNKTLINNLGKTITITKEFIAEVLECAPDYIGWVLEKIKGSHEKS